MPPRTSQSRTRTCHASTCTDHASTCTDPAHEPAAATHQEKPSTRSPNPPGLTPGHEPTNPEHPARTDQLLSRETNGSAQSVDFQPKVDWICWSGLVSPSVPRGLRASSASRIGREAEKTR
jgi:hypothetical protein